MWFTASEMGIWSIDYARKIAGITLVDKLRAILLMEVDFKFISSLYIGKRAMEAAISFNVILSDIFGSKKDSYPIEVPLYRLLFFDIVRQKNEIPHLAYLMHKLFMTELETHVYHW